MGSYGIGIERILSAAMEQNHDAAGMSLPVSIAPFVVVVTPVNSNDLRSAAPPKRSIKPASGWAWTRSLTTATSGRA